MNTPLSTSSDAARKHLSQLTLIRSLLLIVLWPCFASALMLNQLASSAYSLLGILVAYSFINALTYFRLRNPLPVTSMEFFAQLQIDVLCFSILFYFSGGANNPFISFLLVPICISAATLAWRLTWITAIASFASYSLLLLFYIPLPLFEMNHHGHSTTNWHIIGMWFNFSLSAVLITYFVVKMSRTLEDQSKELSIMREDELRNQQLTAVAMLAAGAAHEMNTPLSTMTVLINELKDEYKDNTNLTADLNILKSQVMHCANTLKQLVQESSEANEGKFKEINLELFCNSIVDRWQLMRPNVIFTTQITSDSAGKILHDPRLDYAIINLLNNAADASPKGISLEITSNQQQLVWRIIDAGKGINPTRSQSTRISSTKSDGLGIGLLLAFAVIKSAGGSLEQTPNQNMGTTTEIRLPLL